MKPLVVFLVLVNSLACGALLSNTFGGGNPDFLPKLQNAFTVVKTDPGCQSPQAPKSLQVQAPARTYQESPAPAAAPYREHREPAVVRQPVSFNDRYYEPRDRERDYNNRQEDSPESREKIQTQPPSRRR